MNRKLLVLNGMAILAVVLNHATGEGVTAMFWWAHRYRPVVSPNFDMLGSSTYYGMISVQQLTYFSVPAFLFISGYFIAYAAKSRTPGLSWRIVRTRIYSLLWPYIIWSTLIFVWNALINDDVLSILEYARRLVFGGATGAYFFVPLLCQYYLVSPWMVRIARKQPGRLLISAVILQAIGISISYLMVAGFDPSGYIFRSGYLFISYGVYFVIGLLIGLRTDWIRIRIKRFQAALIGCTFLFAIASVVEYGIIFQLSSSFEYSSSPMKLTSVLYASCFILAYISSDATVDKVWRPLTRIGAMSYGIYLIHPKLLTIFSRVIYHVAPYLLAHQLLYTLLLFVLGVGVSILVMEIVRRSPIHKAYRYLFG